MGLPVDLIRQYAFQILAAPAWLGRPPEHFCAEETALAMAAVAYERARQLTAPATTPPSDRIGIASLPLTGASPSPLIGVACTAALVCAMPFSPMRIE